MSMPCLHPKALKALLSLKGTGPNVEEFISADHRYRRLLALTVPKTRTTASMLFSALARMPFEGLFSKMSRRARYRRRLKVHFQALMEAMVSNFKRLIVTQPIPIH